MAVSKLNRDGWEESEFPVVCETCLGDNPYVRMTKEGFGKECKICARPFTVFRWRPGTHMRYKKTEVCQICSKSKNVCQVCLLDLEYGLPVQVRDAALGMVKDVPVSRVNRDYVAMQTERAVAEGLPSAVAYQKAPINDQLLKLARTQHQPYDKRNRPHVCSFFMQGNCTRGEYCPYLHELPTHDPELSSQNMQDRFNGVNDPVAKKMLTRLANTPGLTPPADTSITTLYVGGVDSTLVSEADLRDFFYQFGEIKSVSMAPKAKAAFVTYTTREAAELAASSTGRITVKGQRLIVRWGKSQQERATSQSQQQADDVAAQQAAAAAAGMQFFYPEQAPLGQRYLSMDPQQQGTKIEPTVVSVNPE
eukprot:TRINITY_DN15731_c0_g1_i1.p1 TRINITY_DN15731_c0_g1~~TRINITY_DN15731_c0_g1_i1.p1  ORF type:complete len:373 (+),score=60.73 TRINITY_DN15731_c0_g1_i1:29-1120(+)